METGGPLICFGATVTLRSQSGSRTVPVEELLAGPGQTTAQPGELLIAVDVPAPAAEMGSCYARLEYRRQMEIAVVGATAVVAVAGDGIGAARIAITAVAPTIRRVPEAEAALVGTDGGRAASEAAAGIAAEAAQPISDVRGSADYRRAMTAVIARRAIEAAVARARGRDVPIPASPALHGAVGGVA
jgi:CO/xanthine dehydrogenase FAD-binding subunit